MDGEGPGSRITSLDGLLGPGIVTVGAEGFLHLSELALAASLHDARPGARCFCLACRAARDSERAASLEGYLALLESERPLDVEEIARVRSEKRPARAPRPAGQPWHPRPARNTGLAGQSAA